MEQAPALWRRLAAALYDGLVIVALWFLGTALLLPLTHGEAVFARGWAVEVLYRLYLLAIAFGFLAIFWTRSGQTLGMLAWGIKVVSSGNGGRLSWRQALVRFLAALLSWLPLGAGFWWVYLDHEQRAWHDRLSGTRLVRTALQ